MTYETKSAGVEYDQGTILALGEKLRSLEKVGVTARGVAEILGVTLPTAKDRILLLMNAGVLKATGKGLVDTGSGVRKVFIYRFLK